MFDQHGDDRGFGGQRDDHKNSIGISRRYLRKMVKNHAKPTKIGIYLS